MLLKSNTAFFPLIMIVVGVVFLLGSVAWLLSTNNTESTIGNSALPQINPYPDIPRITLSDAKAAFDLNNAVFIDTRGESYFSQGHIPGALSITEDQIGNRMDEFDPDAWIITYCT